MAWSFNMVSESGFDLKLMFEVNVYDSKIIKKPIVLLIPTT